MIMMANSWEEAAQGQRKDSAICPAKVGQQQRNGKRRAKWGMIEFGKKQAGVQAPCLVNMRAGAECR